MLIPSRPAQGCAVGVTTRGIPLDQRCSPHEPPARVFKRDEIVCSCAKNKHKKRRIKSRRDNTWTTIQSRSGVIADNVSNNNALLTRLKRRGNNKPFSGGNVILQELSFSSNTNAMYYSGYQTLAISPQDVISAASFDIKQAACAVTVSGLEQIQNSGPEQIIDLIDARMDVAESSLMNLISTGVYSDGTGSGGLQITGLQSIIANSPSTGTVGGINRTNYNFWRNQVYDFSTSAAASASASNIQVGFNTLWASCTRGPDTPDLIVLDNVYWGFYLASLQTNQRFAGNSELANLGFTTIKFMNADVVLDGGIGGDAPANHAYFCNTKYLFFRPYRERNFVALGDERMSTNQDAVVRLLGFAGNMSASGPQFSGVAIE